MEQKSLDRVNDAMQFEYFVSRLISGIVNPAQQETRDDEEINKARFVYSLAKALGIGEYRTEFES
jgi:hypothetical protein